MTAVEYAKSFQKEFNYSEMSIGDLEEILDYYSKDLLESRPTENQVWSMSLIFGSYLGEVMLKNGLSERGYCWGDTEHRRHSLVNGWSEKIYYSC